MSPRPIREVDRFGWLAVKMGLPSGVAMTLIFAPLLLLGDSLGAAFGGSLNPVPVWLRIATMGLAAGAFYGVCMSAFFCRVERRLPAVADERVATAAARLGFDLAEPATMNGLEVRVLRPRRWYGRYDLVMGEDASGSWVRGPRLTVWRLLRTLAPP